MLGSEEEDDHSSLLRRTKKTKHKIGITSSSTATVDLAASSSQLKDISKDTD